MHLDIAIKFVIFYFVFLNTYAHAYLDPGTGSIIQQLSSLSLQLYQQKFLIFGLN